MTDLMEFDVKERTITFPDPLPQVRCSGGSLWMESEGLVGLVKSIDIESVRYEHGEYILIGVNHTIPHWQVYTDKGFEGCISKILSDAIGFKVQVGFTEQGMQDTYRASMEPYDDDSDFILHQFVRV